VAQLKELVLVKFGGSVITKKDVSPPTINVSIITRIAKEILVSANPLVIVLGACAHVHQAAHKFGFAEL